MALVRGGITVEPHVQAFADACQVATKADNYGTYNGHSPPEGPTQALDIFNPDSPAGYALQDRIVEFAMANARAFGVRYTIRREHIWNIERAGEGWRRQTHHGNRTADHYDHVHVTFYAQTSKPGPIPKPHPKGQTMFIYSTAANVDKGSIWLLIEGRAFRLHLPSDVQRLIDKGVVNYGEMSEAFHNMFAHVG